MEIKANETITIATKTYGDVKVWNFKDKELHFTWGQGKSERKGFINLESGVISNVPQNLVNEVMA